MENTAKPFAANIYGVFAFAFAFRFELYMELQGHSSVMTANMQDQIDWKLARFFATVRDWDFMQIDFSSYTTSIHLDLFSMVFYNAQKTICPCIRYKRHRNRISRRSSSPLPTFAFTYLDNIQLNFHWINICVYTCIQWNIL